MTDLRDIPADLCWTEDKGAHRNIPAGAIAHEAADEIERLNAARHADSQRMVRMSDEYEAAQDEIERLMAEHDDYVIRANANVCELNREIERLRESIDTLIRERDAERRAYNGAIAGHLAEIERLRAESASAGKSE